MIARHILLAVLSLLVWNASASASFIVIDSFDNPSPSTFFRINPPSGAGTNPVVLVNATGSGSTRTATFVVDVPNPVPLGTTALTGLLGGGSLEFNSSTFAQARAVLNYSGFNATSGNFMESGTPTFLYLSFLSLDPGIDLATNSPASSMPVDIAISTTGGTLTGSFLLAPPSGPPAPFTVRLNFSDLAGTADLANVLSFDVTFNGGPNQRQRPDFVVDAIAFETFAVPAPPTALLAFFGLPLLAKLRRSRRNSL